MLSNDEFIRASFGAVMLPNVFPGTMMRYSRGRRYSLCVSRDDNGRVESLGRIHGVDLDSVMSQYVLAFSVDPADAICISPVIKSHLTPEVNDWLYKRMAASNLILRRRKRWWNHLYQYLLMESRVRFLYPYAVSAFTTR